MTGATIGSVIIVIAIRQSWGWVFLCSWSFHTFSASNYHDGGVCQVCTVCLCKTYCIQPSRQIFTSIHLSLVLDCALKASWWLRARFHAGGKILSVWSRRQKNMGSKTESHLLCQLFFRTVIFSWERISAARITVGSVRAVSYLDMKEGKMEEGSV